VTKSQTIYTNIIDPLTLNTAGDNFLATSRPEDDTRLMMYAPKPHQPSLDAPVR